MNRLSVYSAAVVLLAASGMARAEPPAAKDSPAQARKGVMTKPPRVLQDSEPELPEGKTLQAPVVIALQLGIDATGKVLEAEVLESGDPTLNDAARAAALKLVFEPAEIDGAPAAVRLKYRYEIQPTVAKPTTAWFGGKVSDLHGKEPLAGVHVDLDDGQSAVTGADGRFMIEAVAPGKHTVTLSGSTFTPIGTDEVLEAGRRYDANYEVDVSAIGGTGGLRPDFEVVIYATKLGSKISSTEVSAEQGQRVAGTGGDVAKVVENLPGVARSTVGSGQIVVWGASPEDTHVYVDGVHIPVLYHEGGFRSVVHSDLVRSVELQPGGYGASYGRGIGGLVSVELRPLEDPGYHGSLQVDAIDAAVSARGSINDHWHFGVAGRRSHLDWVLRQVSSSDVGQFVPIPKYWDAQGRVVWTPNARDSLELGTLWSSDKIDHNLAAADPADAKTEAKQTRFARGYLHYQHRAGTETTSIVPYFGVDHTRIENRFGAIPAALTTDSDVYGLRASHTTNVEPWLTVGAGLDAEVTVSSLSREGSVTTPPREGDLRVFGQLPADQVNADDWSVTLASAAPYAEADFAPFGDRLHVIPGLRIEPGIVRVSRVAPPEGNLPPLGTIREDTGVDPRLAIRWNVTDRITVKAATGVYHQPPLAEDLSSVFGNPNLGPAKARHYLVGGLFRLSKPLSLEVTSFYSHSSSLTYRSPLATPVRAAALLEGGLGRAYGTQFLLRHDLISHFFGWLSFSIIRSERSDPNGHYRLFDFDQTYVFTAVGSYDLGAGFDVGSRFRYSSGYPRTPVIGATYDTRIDGYVPQFGAQNSIRIPSFYSLDVRGAKHFKFGENVELEVYLDVQNVTNQSNPEEIVYNYNYTKRSYITGLPILPVLGGKLSW